MNRERGRLLLFAGVAVAVIVALVVFGLAPSGKGRRRAPGLPREHLAGAAITLPKLLADAGGRPSLVVFWASWCGPCTSEAPAIERFSKTSQGRGRIVGVDWSDGRSSALAFIHRFGWSFPTVRDGEGLIGNEYGMTGLPTTFVLSGKGLIETALRGPQTTSSLAGALRHAERS